MSRALAYLAGRGVAVVRVAYQRGQAPVIEVGNGRQARRLYGEHTGIRHCGGQTLHRFETLLYGCTVYWLADPEQPDRPARGPA